MSRYFPASVRLPALYCIFCASSIHAQVTQPTQTRMLPPVSVVGTRFEQQLLDEPVQTTVVTADDILRSGARTLVDVLALQTSIQVIDNSGSPNRQIDLRGFGMTGDQNTLILLDGQRITENELASADLASIPLASIERIEILRGSGAVLYGRGATGGTINIITKKNQETGINATASATIGSYATRGVSASAGLSHDRLSLNVFADKNETDNYRRNNRSVQENVTAALNYRGDRGPFSLRLSSGQQSLGLPGERTAAQLLTDPRSATTPTNSSSLDSLRIAFATEQKFDLGFFALDLTHRTRESKSFYKDYGYATPDLTKVDALSFSPRFRFLFETWTVNHSFIVGGDWDRWNWNYFSSDVNAVPSSTAQQINTSLYIRNTSNFSSGTSIALGVREQRTVNDVNFSNAIAQQTRKTPAYEIALRQDLRGGWSLHAKSGKSFRLQTVDELRPPWGSVVPTVLEPQTSQDLDTGIRYADSSLTAGFSLFRMKLENEIMYYPTVANNVNLPPTERRGIELDAKWLATAAMTLEGGYSYTDAEFTSGSIGGASVAGKKVPLIPLHKASVAAIWRANERTSLTFRSTYSGEARLDNDQQNTSSFRKPSFLIADFVVVHEIEQWRLRASILNITDENYFTYGGLSGASYYAYPAMGRSVLLTVDRRF
jgi:iron complex outermembrane receptor protein